MSYKKLLLIKWIGSKSKIMNKIRCYFPTKITGQYFEPFAGSLSVFVYLKYYNFISPSCQTFLSDNNYRLICTYLGIQRNPSLVWVNLQNHIQNHSREYFKALQSESFQTLPEVAAQMIYLMRYSFCSKYRETNNGNITLSFRDENIHNRFPDRVQIFDLSSFLATSTIIFVEYQQILDRVKEGDFVYLDPPYHSMNEMDKKSLYQAGGWGKRQQERLKEFCDELTARKVFWMQSNSLDDETWDRYENYRLEQFETTYKIGSTQETGKISSELVIMNYDSEFKLINGV